MNKLYHLRKLLEGHNIERFLKVDDGVFRGSQPMTIEDYAFLVDECGVKTILNLRSDESTAEEREVCRIMGINFVNVPMNHLRTPDNTKEALNTLQDPAARPVFVHCLHGKDRTGLVCALYRILVQGWDKEQAFREMLEWGFDPICANLVKFFQEY